MPETRTNIKSYWRFWEIKDETRNSGRPAVGGFDM
jgi:hypothetical protein